MKNLVIKNPEFKSIFFSIIMIFVVINTIMIFYFNSLWTSLNKDMTINNLAFIGKIVSNNPEMENIIMEGITNDIDDKYIKIGNDIAKKYGYTAEVNLKLIPIINNYHKKSIKVNIVFFSAIIVGIFCVLYMNLKQLYRKLNQLCLGTEKIMDGNFDIKFLHEKEGELSKLSFQFNRMSKCLQLTLKELQGEKEFLKNMISDISHQLKTPLTSLRMFNELLLDGADEQPEVRREFLEKSFVQLDRMEWLIHTLLKMARLETGVIEFNKENENICSTVKNEIRGLKVKFNRKKQQINMHNLDNPIYLVHDKKWMGEALRNIINNAVDYTPEEGKIFISTEETSTIVRIIIEDTGIGIYEKDIPHIFDRFYQGKNNKAVSQNGSGIGLSLTKVIVEKHNGFIEVSSIVGKGTKFEIVFPKYKAH